ncbi:MAG: sigma-70 family RNA polymerase sigma factor [Methylococcales bacterium]
MTIPRVSDDNWFWSESLAKDLRTFLTGRLKCPETAADLTHETYLRLYQRNKQTPPDNARALAFHIAVQLAIDYQRKSTVKNRYIVDVDVAEFTETVSGASAEPEQILMVQQRLSKLQSALHELPEDCRTAFYLHGVEGLKYAQIAARLGISEAMVGKHLARALSYCAAKVNT